MRFNESDNNDNEKIEFLEGQFNYIIVSSIYVCVWIV